MATGIDDTTGKLFRQRLVPTPEVVLEWLCELPGPVAVAYEAGPTGFGLARAQTEAGIRCEVAAPSKLSRPPGDRVKTDAKEAVHLARLLRRDDVVAARVPTVSQEAARDLVRAREDARVDLTRTRHRRSKLLLRHGHVYYVGKARSGAHDTWLRSIRFDQAGTRAAFEADHESIAMTRARRDQLDHAIAALAADSEFAPIVRRLGCVRGIADLTTLGLAVEIGEWDRFTGGSIGAYLGLVPGEYSSDGSRRQGGGTKAGNTHA